ncbi:Glucose/arabinose dehydrogenase, beta-propeller fold [Amycolatopsis arida]|uniref:Glucose/arabinose dehydrogenase, beta-propeller fold n=1 Tax=Amycolatopsis arida TaxID=587909 RepID=A0A1I5NWP3_9PSEU|nr:glucose/arabinose dehydrogenase [Amycolatopsis arida]SFP25671.1 Glucose/arabinose dehydrogenase, beta-propeller fold [Amycolatopsis arida]
MACGGLLLSGCARFDDPVAGQTFEPAPELTAPAGPQPELPEVGGSGPSPGRPGGAPNSVPPPDGCTDFDRAVIATCLDTVSAVAALPGDGTRLTALAGERRSGRVMLVGRGQGGGVEQTEIARLEVDAAGDGGLTGLALSPSYAEDRLVFAYVTTTTDNRVVRFAQGQPPKPVLTGIPKAASGNRGALLTGPDGALLVATGDAGDPEAAADPGSLAGKVLRIDTSGEPAKGNPTAGSRVLARGLHAPGGLCAAADGQRLWVTDRAPGKDVLHRVPTGGDVVPVWSWPERPGVAGCVDWGDVVAVAATGDGNLQNVPVTGDGTANGKPVVSMDGRNNAGYGRLTGISPVTPDLALVGTANKDGGDPVSSDDRVVVISRQQNVPGGGRD